MSFIGFILIGLLAGYIARALVPGRHKLGLIKTLLLGVVGSFVGGLLGYIIFNKDGIEGALQTSGIIGSIIGATVSLVVYDRIKK